MKTIILAFVLLYIQALFPACQTAQLTSTSETIPSGSESRFRGFQLNCAALFEAVDIIQANYIEQCEEKRMVFDAIAGMKAEVFERGYALGRSELDYENDEDNRYLLGQAYQFYLQNTNLTAEDLFNSAMKNVVKNLDPQSSFFSRIEYEELRASNIGNFSAIGVELTVRNNRLTVISVIEDSPADQCGIKAWDIILEIDNKSTTNMSLVDAVKMLRGPKGSIVRLAVRREGLDDPVEFRINRDIVKFVDIYHRMLPSYIAYAHIRAFRSRTADQLSSVLQKIEAENQIQGLILDMRNNLGGLLSQSIEVADLFMESGVILRIDGKKDVDHKFASARQQGVERRYPMIVLVNKETAGAAEIVAGALKENKRALILGDKTKGVGRIQTLFPLANGSAIKLTTHKCYKPSGLSYFLGGVEPDVRFAEEAAKIDLVNVSRIALEQVAGMSPEMALHEMIHYLKSATLSDGE